MGALFAHYLLQTIVSVLTADGRPGVSAIRSICPMNRRRPVSTNRSSAMLIKFSITRSGVIASGLLQAFS